jgi:hypothetical protein
LDNDNKDKGNANTIIFCRKGLELKKMRVSKVGLVIDQKGKVVEASGLVISE